MHWQIWQYPMRVPLDVHSDCTMPSNPAAINEADYPRSYQLICSQIRAAAEKVMSGISKVVLNDLEKRLERRDKCRGFETFLCGIVLLNCVERISWYYKTFDDTKWAAEVNI